jgi:predicted GTPase
MITDSKLDKLLKETIGENMVKAPAKEFTVQTVNAINKSLQFTKPLISGKAFAIYGMILVMATIILALTKNSATSPYLNSITNKLVKNLPDFTTFQFTMNNQVSQITLYACILILFQLTLLKKYILR